VLVSAAKPFELVSIRSLSAFGKIRRWRVAIATPVPTVHRWIMRYNRGQDTHRHLRRGIALNEHYVAHGEIVYWQACKLGCEGIVSKRLGSTYRSGRSEYWLKVKNPAAPAVRREAEED
jgi:hypothetical protein